MFQPGLENRLIEVDQVALPSEERAASKQRHFIFLGHLALCAPFLIIWMLDPHQRTGISPESYSASLFPTILVALGYLGARALLAFRDPPGLKWEYLFPPLDVAIISTLMWKGDQNPLGHVSLLFFFPLVEAAGTLSVGWSISVAGMVVGGAAVASHGFQSTDPFPTIFRYYFFIIVASLAAFLARASSAYRQQVSVAQDRNRIALEMHDGVQAHLVTIASQMELASRLAERDPEQTSQIARESRDSARLAADELRYLVHRLRAPSLEDGFVPALQQFAHNLCSRNRLDLDFAVEGDLRTLGPDTENALFRIAQECMTNAIRHSGAHKIDCKLVFKASSVSLEIADNGCGFDSHRRNTSDHNGLESMKDRARALRGDFKIESKIGSGTHALVEVPL